MNKTKILIESNSIKDNIVKGVVEFLDPITGEVIFRKKNKVILSGSMFTMMKHHIGKAPIELPTYNQVLGLADPQPEYVPTSLEYSPNYSKVFLFAVGIDGCGTEDSQVFDVDYSSWLKPESMIPFKYVNAVDDLNDIEREKYFGRRVLDNGKIAYYFKTFEAEPELNVVQVDGTPITPDVYDKKILLSVDTYALLRLRITETDCRDFFKATTGLSRAKINTITLCEAWRKVVDGKTYFQDIRPITKCNFENERLSSETRGIDIRYYLYY